MEIVNKVIKDRLTKATFSFLKSFFSKTGEIILIQSLDGSYNAFLSDLCIFNIKIKVNGELEIIIKRDIANYSNDSLSTFSRNNFHQGAKIILLDRFEVVIGRNNTNVSFSKTITNGNDTMSQRVPFGYRHFACPWEEEIQELLRKKERSAWSLFKLFLQVLFLYSSF